MSPDLASRDDFERALSDLLSSAVENGLDPSGTWEVRNGDGHPDWETYIVELERSS